MPAAFKLVLGLLTGVLCACGGGASSGEAPAGTGPAASTQEQQCQAVGWQRVVLPVAGLDRLALWKAPANGIWSQGAVVVLHGGGGSHTNFCVANVALIEPQVRFTTQALAAGFAVFLLDSSDRVTDDAGRICGKVWDDQVNPRPNLDLPFIEQILGSVIPGNRPAGSRTEIFMTGHSSGGYMAVRAATRHGERIAAFAPVSAGDPYGWKRDCSPRAGDRSNVFGVGLDLETGRNISDPGACSAPTYPNERPWDSSAGAAKAPFRQFHHERDGINDLSCVEKVAAQLVARGYPRTAALRLAGAARDVASHYWLDDYNMPLLAYFSGFGR